MQSQKYAQQKKMPSMFCSLYEYHTHVMIKHGGVANKHSIQQPTDHAIYASILKQLLCCYQTRKQNLCISKLAIINQINKQMQKNKNILV